MKIQREYVYMVSALILVLFFGVLVFSGDYIQGQLSQAKSVKSKKATTISKPKAINSPKTTASKGRPGTCTPPEIGYYDENENWVCFLPGQTSGEGPCPPGTHSLGTNDDGYQLCGETNSGGSRGGGGYTTGEGWLCRTFGYLCSIGGQKPKSKVN